MNLKTEINDKELIGDSKYDGGNDSIFGYLADFDEMFLINSFLEIDLYYFHKSTKLHTFYMLNFDEAKNERYYWMDYIDGSLLSIIHCVSVRSDQIFDGQYYGQACITLLNNQVSSSETEKMTLYAKWTRQNVIHC